MKLKCFGAGRDRENSFVLVFSFNRYVEDDEMRYLDEVMKRAAQCSPITSRAIAEVAPPSQPTASFDARVEAALKAMWYHPDAEIGTSFWDKWVKNKPAMAAALRAADALSPPSPALPAAGVPEEIVRRLPPSGYQMEPSKWPSDYWISVGDLIEFAHGRGKD